VISIALALARGLSAVDELSVRSSGCCWKFYATL